MNRERSRFKKSIIRLDFAFNILVFFSLLNFKYWLLSSQWGKDEVLLEAIQIF